MVELIVAAIVLIWMAMVDKQAGAGEPDRASEP